MRYNNSCNIIKHKLLFLILIILCINFLEYSFLSFNSICCTNSSNYSTLYFSQINGFNNITDFWNTEKYRLDNYSVNLWIGSTQQIIDQNTNKKYNKTEISYEIPNWVGFTQKTFRINATLFTPTNETGELSKIPGFILFHGLGGKRQDNFQYAIEAITKQNLNIAFLCPDHPGHGESGGPTYSPDNFYYEGDYNKTSHNYLAILAGLRAVNVLSSFNFINSSAIGVGGFSYGGLTTMWITSIYNDKIKIAIPIIATGGLIWSYRESLINLVMQKSYEQMQQFWKIQGKLMDPLFFIGIENYPEICWFIGTNDDFFPYEGINASYNAVKLDSNHKWLQISPNAHHILSDFKGSFYYMINYSFFSAPAPPKISIINSAKRINKKFFGLISQDSFNIEINIEKNPEISIKSVEIIYKYKDIFADPWRRIEMKQELSNLNYWIGEIPTPWKNSITEYYIIVHLNTTQSIWFSSPIYSAGNIQNDLEFLNYFLIFLIILAPLSLIIYIRYKLDVIGSSNRIVKKFILKSKDSNVINLKEIIDLKQIETPRNENIQIDQKLYNNIKLPIFICFILENILVVIGECIIFSSLIFTWIDLGVIQWNHLFIFEFYGTYTDVLSDLAYYTFPFLFGFWILIFYCSLINPIKGGLINLTWPSFIIIVVSFGSKFLGIPSICGIGEYIFLIGALMQIITGIWQKIYRKRLGIPERKYFHYFRKLKFKD